MIPQSRPVINIPLDELIKFRVWEYDLNEADYKPEQDETWVYPVRSQPVQDLANRVVATEVTLANDTSVPALIGNVSLGSESATEEFITISLWLGDRWFALARYFDPEYETFGPDALAAALGLRKEEAFPIRYDISHVAVGSENVVKGDVWAEPAHRLSEDERMELLLE